MMEVSLQLLGIKTAVECKHELCAEGIADYYRPLLSPPSNSFSTPDYRLRVHWQTADRYLFRARPHQTPPQLDGVEIYNPAEGWKPWTSLQPPLLPFWLGPLKNKFTGLHATVVRDRQTRRGTIFIGEAGSGKSTAALILTRPGENYELVSEETSLILNRTREAAPYFRPFGVTDVMNGPKSLTFVGPKVCQIAPVDELSTIDHMVFLEKDLTAQETTVVALESREVFGRLVRQHQDVGSSLVEGIGTLVTLARGCTSLELRWNSFEELTRHLPEVAR